MQLSGLHHKEKWLSFSKPLSMGETVEASAVLRDAAVTTAFLWRHCFRGGGGEGSRQAQRIVQAGDVLKSRKGGRKLDRKARRPGGKAARCGPIARRWFRFWLPPTASRDAQHHRRGLRQCIANRFLR